MTDPHSPSQDRTVTRPTMVEIPQQDLDIIARSMRYLEDRPGRVRRAVMMCQSVGALSTKVSHTVYEEAWNRVYGRPRTDTEGLAAARQARRVRLLGGPRNGWTIDWMTQTEEIPDPQASPRRVIRAGVTYYATGFRRPDGEELMVAEWLLPAFEDWTTTMPGPPLEIHQQPVKPAAENAESAKREGA